MKMKKTGFLMMLIAIVFLSGGLVFGEAEKAEANCTALGNISFTGLSGEVVVDGSGTPQCERAAYSADWWCQDKAGWNDCDDSNNVDHSFCNGNTYYGVKCSGTGYTPVIDEDCDGGSCGVNQSEANFQTADCAASTYCDSGYSYPGKCVQTDFAFNVSNCGHNNGGSAGCAIDKRDAVKSCIAVCCAAHLGAGACCDAGVCKGSADPACLACDCTADGCCDGVGCVATDNGDPDCTCGQLGGTDCGVIGCNFGVNIIANHKSAGICCDGACAGGCVSTCFTGHCLPSLANATATADVCCNGAGNQCFECNTNYVWSGVLSVCVFTGGGGGGTGHGNYVPFDKDVVLVLTEGAEFLLRIAGGIALFVIIFGGIYYMVSGGNPDGQTRAKKIVTYAVIGLAIVLVSYVIIVAVESFAT